MTAKSIDYEALVRELEALRVEAIASLGPADTEHLRKLERWGRGSAALGYGLSWLMPNPVAMALLSTGSMARWAIMMHHLGHKGMDKVPDVPERYTSKQFAQGRRRVVDWLDWILPAAWHYEHDILHHFHTNESADPDLVEENMERIRRSNLPMALKYAVVAGYALTWKLTYYAPSTFQVLKRAERRRALGASGNEQDARGGESYFAAFDLRKKEGREFWKACVLPYGVSRFVVVPALFLPLGPWAAFSVLVNSLGAEALTNIHTFFIIGPNHAGADVPRFRGATTSRGEFFLRQILGSVNYQTGGDLNDFLHGFLNYQIEHHLFPDLSPLAYQRIQPKVRELCERHGLPYIQESVFRRAKKMIDVMVGKTSMLDGADVMPPDRLSPVGPGWLSFLPRRRGRSELPS